MKSISVGELWKLINSGKHIDLIDVRTPNEVQIITGVTVVVGTIAAIATVNLCWLSLPIVMGAGLVFSGLTYTCAMGTMLARMPWNQLKPEATASFNTTSKICSDTAPGCCN